MQVNTFDICAEGNERLRNRNEFILVAPAIPHATKAEVIDELVADYRSHDNGCKASDEEIRQLLNNAIRDNFTVDSDADGCNVYAFIGS